MKGTGVQCLIGVIGLFVFLKMMYKYLGEGGEEDIEGVVKREIFKLY